MEKTRISSIFHEEEKEIEQIKESINSLCERYGLEDAEVLYLVRKKRDHQGIPVEIFSQSLSPLEAVVNFLKNNLGMRFSEIAKRLERDDRTIWKTYHNSIKKQRILYIPKKSSASIPLSIFKSRDLSVLESVVMYLFAQRGFWVSHISELLGKDTSTVRTALGRAKKKMRSETPKR